MRPISTRQNDSGNISKIQEFLGISPTGEAGQQTKSKLLNLENEYNRRANTTRWSGAFVVPETGYVIPYDKLMQAQQIISKY